VHEDWDDLLSRSQFDFAMGVCMDSTVASFTAFEDLAGFVHRVLCEKDALDPKQTPLFRTPLKKRGMNCGVVFHVEGPRLLRTSAVWSADTDRIIFYDSTGTRFHTVELSEAPAAETGSDRAAA
jgi:hypothetical protein